MKNFKRLVVVFIAILLLIITSINFYVSCKGTDGSECDPCKSDSDCKDDMTCEIFAAGGGINQLCAHPDSYCKVFVGSYSANSEGAYILVKPVPKDSINIIYKNSFITKPY